MAVCIGQTILEGLRNAYLKGFNLILMIMEVKTRNGSFLTRATAIEMLRIFGAAAN